MKVQNYGCCSASGLPSNRRLWLPLPFEALRNYREHRENVPKQGKFLKLFPFESLDIFRVIPEINVTPQPNKWPDENGKYWWQIKLHNEEIIKHYYWINDVDRNLDDGYDENRHWFILKNDTLSVSIEGFSDEPDYERGFPDDKGIYWRYIKYTESGLIKQWMEDNDRFCLEQEKLVAQINSERISEKDFADDVELLEDNQSCELEYTFLDIGKSPNFQQFCENLKYNTSLYKLDFFGSSVDDIGVDYLIKAIEHNKTLTELNLQFNDITNLGGQRLLTALEKSNHSIVNLALRYNKINDDVIIKQLERYLSRNKHLAIECFTAIANDDVMCAMSLFIKGVSLKITSYQCQYNVVDCITLCDFISSKINKNLPGFIEILQMHLSFEEQSTGSCSVEKLKNFIVNLESEDLTYLNSLTEAIKKEDKTHDGIYNKVINELQFESVKKLNLKQDNIRKAQTREKELENTIKEMLQQPEYTKQLKILINKKQDFFQANKPIDLLTKIIKDSQEPCLLINPNNREWKGLFQKKLKINPGFFGPLDDLLKLIEEAKQQYQEQDELMSALKNLSAYYRSYRNKIINLSKNNQLTEEQKHEKINEILVSRVLMTTERMYHGYLNEQNPSECSLIPKPNETAFCQAYHLDSDLPGCHIVRYYKDIHYKCHEESMPCFPGVEFAIGSLYNVLTAQTGYGAAPTQLIKLERVSPIVQKHFKQVMIASQTVHGINLFNFMLDYLPDHPKYLDCFDLSSFSAIIVTSLLSCPSDGKPDNYMIQFIDPNKAENQILKRAELKGEDNFLLRIVGIDNDLAFASPIYQKINKNNGTVSFHTVMNCVFFLFPQMEKAVDPKVRKTILRRPVVLSMLDWIKTLYRKNKEYEMLQENNIFNEQEFMRMELPLRFAKGAMCDIYQKWVKIARALEQTSCMTHHDLFNIIYPDIAKHYQRITKAFESEGRDWKNVNEFLYKVKHTPVNDLTLKGKNSYSEKIEVNYKDKLRLIDSIAEFMREIDFSDINGEYLQVHILEEIASISDLEKLIIRNCSTLTDEQFSEILNKLENLSKIHLQNCSGLTSEGIMHVVEQYQNKHKRKVKLKVVDSSEISVNYHISTGENNKFAAARWLTYEKTSYQLKGMIAKHRTHDVNGSEIIETGQSVNLNDSELNSDESDTELSDSNYQEGMTRM